MIRRAALFLGGWIAAAAVLLVMKWPTLGDAHYWDAVGCYVMQARFISEHGLNLASYHLLPFIRPPLFTGAIALLMAKISAAHQLLHAAACAWNALCLPATALIVRRLGGGWAAAILGAVICLVTPLYFAQAPMVQTDLPAAAICAVAWGCLLAVGAGGTIGYAAVGSLAVLTKESSYFLCLPAAALLFWRQAPGTCTGARIVALLRAWPAAVPGMVLFCWLLLHRAIMGEMMAADHTAALGSPDRIASALLHNYIEGGRWLLWACAAPCLLAAWRGADDPARRREVLCTGLAAAVLPLCFPGLMPRYMLLSLPMLCALAALGIWRQAPGRRLGLAAVAVVVLCLNWRGESWHENGGHHLEANLAYRDLLALHERVARDVWAARPGKVLAGFPFQAALQVPAADGYLPTPVPARWPAPADPLAALCQYDLLIDSQGGDMRGAVERLGAAGVLSVFRTYDTRLGRGALTPSWAREDHTIRIYRIRCPSP